MLVADDSGLLGDGQADSPAHDQAGSGEGRHEPTTAVRLLVCYDKALGAIAAKSFTVFLQHRSVSPESSRPYHFLHGANRIAAILAEAHMAARVDALLRRGRRLRALDPQGPDRLDLGRLQDFRDSLSPVAWRTLALWVILLALAIAFPVATITDYLRVLTPTVISCPFESLVDRLSVGTVVRHSCIIHHAGWSLVKALLSFAHLNMSPGSFIDTALSARASGPVILLLLAVVMILSLCFVLVVFRSGFRLKRLVFSLPPETLAARESLPKSGNSPGSLYELERDAFGDVSLPPPREFPLDLAVSAGLLVLPLTVSVTLIGSATHEQLDLRTRIELAVFATGLIVAVCLRLWWLVRVWRKRINPKKIKLQKQSAPNALRMLDRTSVYAAVLLATACLFWDITLFGAPGEPPLGDVAALLLLGPALAWSLSFPWWYELHCALNEYDQRHKPDYKTFRDPILCVVPPLATLAYILFYTSVPFLGSTSQRPVFVLTAGIIIGTLLVIGLIGSPVGIYRMGRELKRRRYPAMGRAWGIGAGAAATAMYAMPPVVFIYFRRSLDQMLAENPAATLAQHVDAESPAHAAVSADPKRDVATLEAGSRRNGSRARTILAGAGAVVVVFMAIGAISSHASGVSTTPSGNAGPGSIVASSAGHAKIGSYFDVQDVSGDTYRVTLVQIIDPAQSADQDVTPDSGKRFVGAVFEIEAMSGSPQGEDANDDAALIGSNGQTYSADLTDVVGYPNFSDGSIDLAQGNTAIGSVTFQVPDGVKVTGVQWSAINGLGSTAQWDVQS